MKNDPKAVTVLKAMKTPTGFSEFNGDIYHFMNTKVRKQLGRQRKRSIRDRL